MRIAARLGFLLLALTGLPATAQTASPLTALTTADATRGWEAVGRLDFAGRAFCTGALIAENLVLTAAHCLYDRETGARIEASDIQFLAGWRNGRAAAYRGVRRALPHPDYDFAGRTEVARVAYDLALLELDQPIRLPSIRPFETDIRPRKGDEVGVVSYAHDRAEAPSLQEACTVLARQDGLLVLSCEVDFGSSGAPVFSIHEGVARIVSVVSAKAESAGRLVSLGSAIEVPLADLRLLMAAETAPVQAEAAAIVAGLPRVRRLGASSGGAKFVKP